MNKGDLVKVTEERGIGVYHKSTYLGVGVILDVEETDDIKLGGVQFNAGDQVTVMLSDGKVDVFCPQSLEVL